MKIKKQTKQVTVTSCDNPMDVLVVDNTAGVPVPNTTVVSTLSEIPTTQCSPFDDAKGFIQSAISSLASIAGENQVAKDSIANLAVVLLDLQSC